jgi:hypothetical protein
MSRAGAILFAVAVLAGGAAPAAAQVRRPAPGDIPIDVSAIRPELEVWTDGDDHFLVFHRDPRERHLFYGDGETMYAQTTSSRASNQRTGERSISFWSPRTAPDGLVERGAGAEGIWQLRCGDRTTRLTRADPATSARILERARFVEPRWRRHGVALARDESGTFYYVDRLAPDFGVGYRLFVGKKGRMVERRLSDVVDDSVGLVFYTAAGALWIDRSAPPAARWHRGKQRKALRYLPLVDSGTLIWEELGVYRGERLGVPCDDL